jgi:hypothetical protein
MVVEIRAKGSVISQCKKVSVLDAAIPFTPDETTEQAAVMVKDGEGALVAGLVGNKAVIAFCKNGYNKIQRACPLRHRKCIGERCAWYIIKNGTGDCAQVWSVLGRG